MDGTRQPLATDRPSPAAPAETVQIDDLDRQIIFLLQENARRTMADIATRVNLSAPAVKRRIDRLERYRVITGYTMRIDHDRIGASIDAFTELRLSGDTDADEVMDLIKQMPEVSEAFTIAGDPDALVRIRVEDVAHLKKVVNGLRRNSRITGTKTLMVLDHWGRGQAG